MPDRHERASSLALVAGRARSADACGRRGQSPARARGLGTAASMQLEVLEAFHR
eukprot:CAMPEP_0179974410 /NCGR_PEP_ID=MMETSP0983-20121128/38041_1 /TAXON_ID=483367 /ORGANISM="non described non described, Strain CCMP 2436" /LENGTH=53 /DNA_ID=CAMNT_0021890589 /DNA_START=376 /DNA_END=533 /DNA_ORIENTATION=+